MDRNVVALCSLCVFVLLLLSSRRYAFTHFTTCTTWTSTTSNLSPTFLFLLETKQLDREKSSFMVTILFCEKETL